MAVFISLVTFVSRLCGILAAVMVALTMLILCELVFQRYGLGDYSAWQGELTTYLMVAIAFVGAPYVALTKGHIRVDFLPHDLGKTRERAVGILCAGVSLAVTLVLAIAGWRFFQEAYQEHWVTDTAWGLNLWVPYLSLPLGAGVLSLQYAADLFCLLARQPPFPVKDMPDPVEEEV